MATTIALAGNPNAGKTTLFNGLTGARQHVGNYPGVTVEKKEGTYLDDGREFHIVDLPGTYSLTAYSLEEVVARDFLVNEKPSVVINIVDGSNLERNLYLTVQFLEMGVPVCIALNMIDVAKTRGITIDEKKLSKLIGVPVVPMIARSGVGKKEIMDVANRISEKKTTRPPLYINYGEDIEQTIDTLSKQICDNDFLTYRCHPRWLALKYIENDEHILKLGREANSSLSKILESIVENLSDHMQDTLNTYPEAMIADHRYGFIKSLIKQGVVTHKLDQNRLHLSDNIDKVLTNRLAGPAIMIAVLFGLYHFVFSYSQIPVGWFEIFFEWLGQTVSSLLPDGLLKSLIVSGIIDGVGGVLGFVPLIMFMFFGIAFLEDSGYLARVAFMLDRVFRIFGLHGSSVMAFIVSGGIAGGCAVPGIMAARTLKSPRERLATLLTVPFMNCGAKLPVFALLVAAFFSENEAMFMMLITAIAWCGALLVAKLLRITVIKGASTPFVMELPPYRLPTLKGMLIHTWERTWQYVKKAGTTILAISVILWAMMTFPRLPEDHILAFEQTRQTIQTDEVSGLEEKLQVIDAKEAEAALRYSIAGRFGTALESISQYAGFEWRTNIALVGGFAAKEVIVATLGTAYSLGDVDPEETTSLSQKLANSPAWRPLVALSLILFVMFYSPCFVSVVCIVKEAGSWKWGIFSMVFNTLLAFSISVLTFQIGSLMGF
jgi:ferrous iron transport protein B